MSIDTRHIQVAVEFTTHLVEWIELLNEEERLAFAHTLQKIYEKHPAHKEWLQKLHEMLDIS